MAVKKTNKETIEVKEDVVTVDEAVIEETTTEGVEVKPEAIEEVEEVSKNVRIRALRNHNCFIGGERYNLIAGQCYNVPANVKAILSEAGLLAPL